MKCSSLFSAVIYLALASVPVLGQTYKVSGSVQIGGTGGWDYLTTDSADRKLFVSHGSEVVVVDLDSHAIAGRITGLNRIHGIAVAPELGVGFISDGGSNELVFFGLKDFTVTKHVKAGTNPDGIVYDTFSKRVFTFNGRSQDATAIDAQTGAVVGTIPLAGKPEFPVSDAHGSVYANIEDKSEIVRIDPKTLTVKARWPLAPCDSPSGLAIDSQRHTLFSVCDNKLMAIVDGTSGKILATPAIGDGPDAAAYDSGTGQAFASNGRSGTLTVVNTKGGKFEAAQTVTTAQGARTMALDQKTNTIYLATADFGPPAASPDGGRARPSIKPGTFKLVIVSPE